jgi:UDP-glucuronate 4-epimerase
MQTILLTGCAGFIGFNFAKYILEKKNYFVIGIDNLTKDKSFKIKKIRLNNLKNYKKFNFYKVDITKNSLINKFKRKKITYVLHLAAVAGVRNSFNFPELYFNNNIKGFYNLIELSKILKVKHFVYASSSSVYGNNNTMPSKEEFNTDTPLSFYSASKKTNEVMAYAYSSMYKFPSTGIRFFSVYGPYGRSDMAILKFIDKILKNKKITLFNSGNHFRDFTYIDDAVLALDKILKNIPSKNNLHKIFNVSTGKSTSILELVALIEDICKVKAIKKRGIKQVGDVFKTHGDTSNINKVLKKSKKTSLRKGLELTIDWYNKFKDKI